ncbi:hypothetical protein CFBP3846_P500031 (plasmid) [Pseudomonas syringae pv. avii]|uniref:Uncharacterized protein n=1 Tax=Pseudomonas syringae pv. avii TaxID=663959 RepID=A0ABY1UHC6_PSESX|nr:hypothetical protein CFBP3846_P500031 [Pseudomonas syringae pv. avii]
MSDSHAQSLAEASETLKDTRDALSFGRGNVDADLELTQGESGQRVAASRVVNQRCEGKRRQTRDLAYRWQWPNW